MTTLGWGHAMWVRARARGCPPDLYAVTVVHRRDHPFAPKPKPQKKCAVCNMPKTWEGHHGYPPSFNVAGSGANRHAYQATKQLWQSILTPLIEEAGLPRGLGHVHAEATIGFPKRIERDQGNFRVYLEKALGDALEAGGWIENDAWSRYEFGDLRQAHEKGEAWTRVTLVPSWEPVDALAVLPAPPPPGQMALGG